MISSLIKREFRLLFLIPALFLLLVFVSCGGDDDQENKPSRNYQLVWEDNFDGVAGTSPDPTKWTYDIGTGINGGWGNNELQYYTNRPDNVAMDGNGHLEIIAKKETFGQGVDVRNYTSARIKTQGLFAQTYGRFEARIQTPFGQGLWPAFWMLGTDIETVSWPQCGEIDIMELVGNQPAVIHGSVHGPGYSGGRAVTSSYSETGVRFDTDFYVFAVEWGEDFIDYYVDDVLYQTITPSDTPGEWVFNKDFFLILNVAVGGNWPGAPSNTTPFPQKMIVDYVRVYEEVE